MRFLNVKNFRMLQLLFCTDSLLALSTRAGAK